MAKKSAAEKLAYREAAIKEVLERIASGESLNAILSPKNKPKHLPARSLFNEWLSSDKDLADKYARATESRADVIFEEIIAIADEDPGVTESGSTDNGKVQHNRLRIDARKWMLGKMRPMKYGDKLDVTTNGNDMKGGGVVLVVNGQPRNEPISDENEIKG